MFSAELLSESQGSEHSSSEVATNNGLEMYISGRLTGVPSAELTVLSRLEISM